MPKNEQRLVLTPTKPGLPGSFIVACGAPLAVKAEATMTTRAVMETIVIWQVLKL